MESSACLPGYARMLLDADTEEMFKFGDWNEANYNRQGLLARELGQPLQEAKETAKVSGIERETQSSYVDSHRVTHSSHTILSGSHNWGLRLVDNAGTLNGFCV